LKGYAVLMMKHLFTLRTCCIMNLCLNLYLLEPIQN